MMTYDEMLNQVFLTAYEEQIKNYATEEEFLSAMRERWEHLKRTDLNHYLIVESNAIDNFLFKKGYSPFIAKDVRKLATNFGRDVVNDGVAAINNLIVALKSFDEKITGLAIYPLLPTWLISIFCNLKKVYDLDCNCVEKSELDDLIVEMYKKYNFRYVNYSLTPVEKSED